MSESEKRKCYFVQYSEDFLYDPKVQKLYSIPNTGKAFVAVYLHLMLLAAKNGGFIVHDPLYATLGEQLEPHMLYTTKDEIDYVIRFFANPDFAEKYIQRVDDIYTFLQAQEMTQSKTVGALNKAKQRKKQAEKQKPTLSDNCPPLVGNTDSNTDSNIDSNIDSNTTTTVAEVAVVLEAKTVNNSNLQQKSKKLEDVGIRTNVELLASRYSDAELDSYIAWAKATAKTDFAGFLYRALVDGWELPQKYVPKITCPRCNGTQLENYTLADGIETTGLCSLCKGKGFIRKETQNES